MKTLDASDLDGTGYEVVKRVDALQLVVSRNGQLSRAYQNAPDSVTFDALPTDDHRYVVRLDPEHASEACSAIMRQFGSYGSDGESEVVYFYHTIVPTPYGDGGEPATEGEVESIPGVLKCVKLGVTLRGVRYQATNDGLVYA